jgi:hypothetical protein
MTKNKNKKNHDTQVENIMKLNVIHLDFDSNEIPYTCSNCQS